MSSCGWRCHEQVSFASSSASSCSSRCRRDSSLSVCSLRSLRKIAIFCRRMNCSKEASVPRLFQDSRDAVDPTTENGGFHRIFGGVANGLRSYGAGTIGAAREVVDAILTARWVSCPVQRHSALSACQQVCFEVGHAAPLYSWREHDALSHRWWPGSGR
jgi:hypothetical protein